MWAKSLIFAGRWRPAYRESQPKTPIFAYRWRPDYREPQPESLIFAYRMATASSRDAKSPAYTAGPKLNSLFFSMIISAWRPDHFAFFTFLVKTVRKMNHIAPARQMDE